MGEWGGAQDPIPPCVHSMSAILPMFPAQIGDYDAAVHDMLRGGETDLGYAVALVTSSGNKEVALGRMAMRCEGLGLLRESLRLLQLTREFNKEVRGSGGDVGAFS